MLRLAVCDDDAYVIEQIESYIHRIKNIPIEYEVYFSAEELCEDLLSFDIFLLDIEINSMSGIQLARRIRERNQCALIIFMTSYARYVIDVFDVVTFDFILKPLNYEKFRSIINKASNYLLISKNSFVFNSYKTPYVIPCQNIMYIEKVKRKAYIYTNLDKTYECNMTVDEIQKKLPDKMFVKINKGCIVNLAMISQIMRDEISLINGTKLYIARDYKMNIKMRHLDFYRARL